MDFFDAVKKRRSVRKFLDRQVEGEKLGKILGAANAAPSAGNLQSYEIIVVRDQERKSLLAAAGRNQTFVAEAPVVLVFLADCARSAASYGERGSSFYAIQDATIAAAYSQLAATALGLATVWKGGFDEEEVRNAVGAPQGATPVAIIPVGYAAEEPKPTPRRKLSDIAREGSY